MLRRSWSQINTDSIGNRLHRVLSRWIHKVNVLQIKSVVFLNLHFMNRELRRYFLVFINNKLPFSTPVKQNLNLFVEITICCSTETESEFVCSRRVKVSWLCVTLRFRYANHLVTLDQHILSKRRIVKISFVKIKLYASAVRYEILGR